MRLVIRHPTHRMCWRKIQLEITQKKELTGQQPVVCC